MSIQYFKATEIAEKSWQIEYAFTDQEHVYCYLVEGQDTALLIDTMYGYGSLRAFCETLTDKPIERADGKLFNMCYNPEKRFEQEKTARVIDFQPVPMF